MPDSDFQDIHDALGIQPTDPNRLSVQLAPSNSTYNEIMGMPARAAGVAANALGITDAISALRGEMTEEEAKNFALGALPGLIPGLAEEKAGAKAAEELAPSVLKGVYENAWKSGKMPFSTLANYIQSKAPGTHAGEIIGDVAYEGGAWVKELTQKYGHWADIPYTSKNTSKDFGDIHDALGIQETEPTKVPVATPSLDDDAIAKALAKNPGASISDIAGVHLEGPSSSVTDSAGTPVPPALGKSTFPRDVPFSVPPQAQQLGFTTPALHGTRASVWEGPPDQLKLPENQIGVHFGNPKQAAHFSTRGGGQPSSYEAPRTYPAVLQMNNPLETKDLGSWGKDNMIDALHEINEGTHVSWVTGKKQVLSPEAAGQFPLSELDKLDSIQDVRDYLVSKGYDSIKYINSVEDAGHPSYILYQDSPTKPGYVIGARSPFAKFDPNQLHLPSLAAGGAGLLLYPFRGDEERE